MHPDRLSNPAPSTAPATNLTLRRRVVRRVLGALIVLLVALNAMALVVEHIVGPLSVPMGPALVRWFSVNEEANLPTFYASLTLLALAGLIALHGLTATRRRTWLSIALVMVGLAVEEAIQIHEMFVPALRNAFGFSGILRFAWVVPYTVLLVIFFIATIRTVTSIPRRPRLRLFVAAGIFLAGAVGIEMVGGAVVESAGEDTLTYGLLTSVEETLEMVGALVAIDVFLELLAGARVTLHMGGERAIGPQRRSRVRTERPEVLLRQRYRPSHQRAWTGTSTRANGWKPSKPWVTPWSTSTWPVCGSPTIEAARWTRPS